MAKDALKTLEKQLTHESKASEKALHAAHNALEAAIKAEMKAAKVHTMHLPRLVGAEE